MKTIGIIGGGNMGEAIISRVATHYKVLLCEKSGKRARSLVRRYRIKTATLPEVVKRAQVLILAVKPQDFDGVLAALGATVRRVQIVVSIAAGITTGYIEKRLAGEKAKVVRVMPNMPARIGAGVTALCAGRHASAADVKKARKIFDLIGETVVTDEKWMDAVTAVSGSGPAYVFYFVECFMKAAGSLGLNARLSRQLVTATLDGSVRLLQELGEDAGDLRARVTSKGGTTQAALDVFTKRKVDRIFQQALKAARQRAKELARR